MKNFCVVVTLILISALPAYAGKWATGTTAPATCTVGDSWTDTNGTADNRFYTCTATNTWTLNSNQTAIDAKANKSGAVMLWSEWGDGSSFTTSSPPVAYNGSLYKCTAPYTKVAGETPNTQTEYFTEVTGSSGGIAHATSDGAYYASRNGAWAPLTGVFLTPTGSAAGLIDFPTLNQSTTGNAATAAALQTARTIGGVSFDGSANINLPGVNATGNQNTSGTAAGLTAQYVDWNSASGGASIANKPTIPTVSDTAYGAGWNGDTGAASKNALYDKIETISGGSMTYPGAGVPISTGTSWGTSITLGAGASAALGYAPDAAGGFLLANTYLDDPLISWDTATITETADSPVAGTNKIGVKANTFQSYDANMILWPSAISATEVQYLDGLPDTLVNLLGGKQAADSDLTDLADGSLTGSKVSGYATATTSKSTSYTIGTDSINESYGGTVYVTGATTITAPAAASGMNFSVVTIGDIAVSLDVNAADKMILDGVTLADGDKATNSSKSGDTIVCQYYSADGWYCWSGTVLGGHWTDGN